MFYNTSSSIVFSMQMRRRNETLYSKVVIEATLLRKTFTYNTKHSKIFVEKKGLSLWRVVHKSTSSNCFLLLALLILPSFWFPSEGALYKEVAFFSLARAKVTSKYKSKKVLLAFTAALLFLALTSLLAAAAVVTPASLFCAVLKHSKNGILH